MQPRPATKLNCKIGTQIVYVPNHANGDIHHEASDRGFVTSANPEGAFCRFWSKQNSRELRTTANSEFCKYENLVVLDTHRQTAVIKTLVKIKEDWDTLFKPQV